MGLDSDKIRQEIRGYLQKHGRTRSKKLADEVMKKVGSEKTVYREIKSMFNSGELKKTEKSRADIEYELAEFSEVVERNYVTLSEQLKDVRSYFIEHEDWIYDKKFVSHYTQRLFLIVQTMKLLNRIENRLRIISAFPAFMNPESVPILQKEINEVWSKVLSSVNQYGDDKLVSELIMNFPHVKWVDAKPHMRDLRVGN